MLDSAITQGMGNVSVSSPNHVEPQHHAPPAAQQPPQGYNQHYNHSPEGHLSPQSQTRSPPAPAPAPASAPTTFSPGQTFAPSFPISPAPPQAQASARAPSPPRTFLAHPNSSAWKSGLDFLPPPPPQPVLRSGGVPAPAPRVDPDTPRRVTRSTAGAAAKGPIGDAERNPYKGTAKSRRDGGVV